MTIALGLSLLGNAVFVLGTLWTWHVGRRSIGDRLYVLPNRVRRHTFFGCYPVRPGDIVWLGDSITAGAQWSEMFPHHPVKNRGIGGDTTTGVLARLDQVIAGSPSHVFLLIGTNDLSTGVPHERIVATYAAILDRLVTEAPATTVVVQSVMPRGRTFVRRVRALNTALAELSAARGCRFVDLTPVFADADGAMQRRFSNDELHLLGDGYVAWQRALAPHLP